MYQSVYTYELMHQDRLRDAEKRRSQMELIREATEQLPDERQMGLLHQISQWMHVNHAQSQPQGTADVRPAHAI